MLPTRSRLPHRGGFVDRSRQAVHVPLGQDYVTEERSVHAVADGEGVVVDVKLCCLSIRLLPAPIHVNLSLG